MYMNRICYLVQWEYIYRKCFIDYEILQNKKIVNTEELSLVLFTSFYIASLVSLFVS